MKLKEYQALAARTAPVHLSDEDRRMNCAMGLVGEFGELVDLMKKRRFHGQTLDAHYDSEPTPTYADYRQTRDADKRNAEHCQWWMDSLKASYDAELRDEFGDAMWYLSESATISGLPLELPECYDEPSGLIGIANMIADAAAAVNGRYLNGSNLRSLVGDMRWLIERHGFTLDEVLERNVEKLRERYPDGFSEQASRERTT